MPISSESDKSLRLAVAEDGELVDISSTDATVPNGSALFIGTGGNVKVDLESGSTLTFYNVFDGTFLPISVKKVYKTGTTASNILSLR